MTTSLLGVTNDPTLSLLVSRRSGDGAVDRLNGSEIENSPSVERDVRSLDTASGFDINLMQPQNISTPVTLNFASF